jgi:hypothetical protein
MSISVTARMEEPKNMFIGRAKKVTDQMIEQSKWSKNIFRKKINLLIN